MDPLPLDSEQHHSIEKPILVDEISSTEYYIGTSRNFSSEIYPSWKIKKIWKIGSVWHFGYPNGNQNYVFKWADRFSYSYSQ